MNFEALDGTKLIILMVAGAVFAAVGLYLMVRPKAGDAAKVELFGLKFESSSAGLLVFLVGAIFLALPLFVPEAAKDKVSNLTPSSAIQTTSTGQVTLPDLSSVEEVEPNDERATANLIAYAQRVKGRVVKDAPDWFVMPVPEGGVQGSQIMLRHVSGNETRLEVYNARDEHKGWIKSPNGAVYLDIKSDFQDKMYFKVHTIYTAGTDYELAVVQGN